MKLKVRLCVYILHLAMGTINDACNTHEKKKESCGDHNLHNSNHTSLFHNFKVDGILRQLSSSRI